MKAFTYTIWVHIKLSMRSKEMLVHFYIVPLVFYLFIGGVFTSINPIAYQTLIQTMTIFAVSMGGILGSPYANIEFYGSDIKRAYQVGTIPIWIVALGNFISTTVNLFFVSMIILLSAPIIFDAQTPSNILSYLLSLMLIIVSSVGIGTVLGLCFKSTSKMGMVSQLIFLPSLMLSGIMFESSLLPTVLSSIGKILPATWAFKAMTASELDVVANIVLLLIIVIMFCLSAARIMQLGKQE
ncbi:MAG: ABC transporter permease [Eubacteriales bacterium]